jgi:hypothetical protein
MPTKFILQTPRTQTRNSNFFAETAETQKRQIAKSQMVFVFFFLPSVQLSATQILVIAIGLEISSHMAFPLGNKENNYHQI